MDILQICRHTDDMVTDNLLHQGGLSCAILPDDTVAVILLHLQDGVLESLPAAAAESKASPIAALTTASAMMGSSSIRASQSPWPAKTAFNVSATRAAIFGPGSFFFFFPPQ